MRLFSFVFIVLQFPIGLGLRTLSRSKLTNREIFMCEKAKEAVESQHWRWMPGMLAEGGHRILATRNDGTPVSLSGAVTSAVPNLQDPATAGCLLALVQKAWSSYAQVTHHPVGNRSHSEYDRWVCTVRIRHEDPDAGWIWRHFSGSSKVGALVDALKGVPENWGSHDNYSC